MWQLLQELLDIVLPRKDRVVRIDSYSLQDLSIQPTVHALHGTEITALMSYRTKAVDDLIRALKYDHAGSAAALLSAALAEYLREEVANMKMFSAKPVVLVPVPLHSSRVVERGFNQVERVLEKLPAEFRDGTLSRVATDVLVRTRATPQQTRLSRRERLKNVAGAFSVPDVSAVQNTNIILVDDVTTTGATLAEAAKPFGKISVTLLALAHA